MKSPRNAVKFNVCAFTRPPDDVEIDFLPWCPGRRALKRLRPLWGVIGGWLDGVSFYSWIDGIQCLSAFRVNELVHGGSNVLIANASFT